MSLTPTSITGDIQVNTFTTNSQQYPSIAALADGGFVVTWTSSNQDGSGRGIYAQRYNANGTPVGAEFRVNTATPSDQSFSSVAALDGGGFVVTWQSFINPLGSNFDIYHQRFDSDGNAQGTEARVNTNTFGAQTLPSVAALDGGGFIVTWNSDQDGSGIGIYGQRYNASGASVGAEFRVNTTTANSQANPSVASLANGGFIVTWASSFQDGSGSGIYGQRYDASGALAGSEFRINTTTAGDQTYPSVAALADGGFIVTWQSFGQDGSGWGIYGQRYSASGAPAGTEFQVNTQTLNWQYYSSVAALDDGGFIVTWSSEDGGGWGIYGQRYAGDGSVVGEEFRLNQTIAGNQIHESYLAGEATAVLSDGTLVSTWSGQGAEEVFVGLFNVPVSIQANDDVYLGDVDVVISQQTTQRIFLNDGSGTVATGGTYASTNVQDIALGDFDGDGDLDLYRVRSSGGDQVAFNDGSGAFTTFTTLSPAVGGNIDVALGDVDGDGDLDALSIGFSTKTVWLNDGSGSFTSGQSIALGSTRGVALGDVDGDGDLDAVFAVDGANKIYLNDGTGTAFTDSGQSLGTTDTQNVALADLNGDGAIDIYFAERNAANGGSVYINDGTGSFTLLAQTLPARGPDSTVVLGDLDNDGDIDAITGSAGATAADTERVLLNDGTGLFTASEVSATAHGTQQVALADLDGDGDLDLHTASGFAQPSRSYLNDGTGSFTELQAFGAQFHFRNALGDLDHDGFSEDAVQVLRVLDNDTDAQGDVLTISAVDATSANGAALSISNGGRTVTYDPTAAAAIQALAAGATLDDMFSYTVSDGTGGVDIATVTIRIAGAAEPDLFTTGNDTVDLNAYDLSLYALSQVNDALAGDDDVILSASQNTGQYFDGNAGDDTITGSAAVDNVNGGTGADEIHLTGGDDTIRLHAGEAAPGEILDGGADFDTLSIDGGGAVDLTGVTLTDIENIELTSGASTTLSGITATQAALISNAAGTNDIVQIASGGVSEVLVADLILDVGVERVEWSIPGFASAVEAVPDGSGGFVISYDDGDDLKPWDTIDAQYDSLGRKVSQTNDYDFPGPEGGITLNFTYDPVTGFATTIVNTDGHLTRTFSTITTTLENGVVTKVDTINDNNTASNADDTLVEQFFTAGVITLERTTDTSSGNAGKPWLYIDREYDGGVTQIFRTFWDAGVNGGGQQVVGTAGSQVIEGVVAGGGVSTTDDALVGGAGADTFRFVPGFGHDTIYDFADGADLLDLSSYAAGIETLAELQNAATITQVAFGAGFNTVIAFNGTSDQITIRNLTVAQLDNGDFAV